MWWQNRSWRARSPWRQRQSRAGAPGSPADGICPDAVGKAKAEYEGDKYAKSQSVQSRLLWWKMRAGEHSVESYPLTVDELQLFGDSLKADEYRCSWRCEMGSEPSRG